MKIILKNGTELTPAAVTGGLRYVQGINRDALTFAFPESENMENLDSMFTPANCESIAVKDDDGNEFIYKGYTVRVELSKLIVEAVPASSQSEAVFETRITVTMAQHTYTETQLEETQAQLDALLTGEDMI